MDCSSKADSPISWYCCGSQVLDIQPAALAPPGNVKTMPILRITQVLINQKLGKCVCSVWKSLRGVVEHQLYEGGKGKWQRGHFDGKEGGSIRPRLVGGWGINSTEAVWKSHKEIIELISYPLSFSFVG